MSQEKKGSGELKETEVMTPEDRIALFDQRIQAYEDSIADGDARIARKKPELVAEQEGLLKDKGLLDQLKQKVAANGEDPDKYKGDDLKLIDDVYDILKNRKIPGVTTQINFEKNPDGSVGDANIRISESILDAKIGDVDRRLKSLDALNDGDKASLDDLKARKEAYLNRPDHLKF